MGAPIESGKKKGGITPVINVTPLVDVVLVLLIIFMLVIPNVQNEGRPIEMIKVDAADRLADDQEPIIVTVDREERYLVGPQEMSAEAAVAEVVALASANPRQRVLLRADAGLRYAPVRALLRELQEGGVTNVALAVGVARNAADAGLAGQAAEGEG